MPVVTLVLASLLAVPTASAEDTDPQARPCDPGIGIGGGVTFPASPLGLNTASARFRLNDKLALEPVIGFVSASGETETETNNNSTTSEESGTAFAIDSLVRYTLQERTRVAVQALGGIGYYSSSVEIDPDGSDNNTTTTSTSMKALWGLGLECFVGPHWSVSADATNPLYESTSTTEESQGNNRTVTTALSSIGVIWSPTVRVMAHLNF